MTEEDIVQELVNYLELHSKQASSIEQAAYKRDLFRLFAEAYRSGYFKSGGPLLTPDSLNDVILTRWFPDTKKKKQLLGSLITKWGEWRFALDNYNRV